MPQPQYDDTVTTAVSATLTATALLRIDAELAAGRRAAEAVGPEEWAVRCQREAEQTLVDVFGLTPEDAAVEVASETRTLLTEGVPTVELALEQLIAAQRAVIASGQAPLLRAEAQMAGAQDDRMLEALGDAQAGTTDDTGRNGA